MKAWEKNGYADIVLGLCEGSKMNSENLFAQHSPDGWGIHCPPGWGVNAEVGNLEQDVDRELWTKYDKAKAEIARMNRESEMHVVYTVDVQGTGAMQFLDQLEVSIYSIRESLDDKDRLCVHILYNNIPSDLVLRLQAFATDRFRVEFKKIPEKDVAYMQSLSKHDPRSAVRVWSGIVYARLWIPLAFPDIKRAIYLDADTLVQKSLKPLWELDLEGNFLGMTPPEVPEYGHNSGCMLMDCEAMRNDNDMWHRLGAFLEKEAKTYYLPDQTAINRFFADKIKTIDKGWCWPPRPGVQEPGMKDAPILHFYVTKKPTRFDDDMTSKVMWNAVLVKAEEEAAKCL
jgi:lipopolysaccharide biosynthesis glycosyltransferase